MAVWIVLGCILLLLLLLLFAPVSLRVSWREGVLRLSAHYLFLRLADLSPEGEARREKREARAERSKRGRKKKPKRVKKEQKKKTKEKAPLSQQIQLIWNLLLDTRKPLNLLRRNLVFYKVAVYGSIAREDAHQTAVAYGLAGAMAQVFLEILGQLFVLRRPTVELTPNFAGNQSKLDIAFRVRMRPVFALVAAVSLLARATGTLRRHRGGRKAADGQRKSQRPSGKKPPAKVKVRKKERADR